MEEAGVDRKTDILPLKKTNSLQALTRLRPHSGSEWCVAAHVLNKDIVDEDGKVDTLFGMMFLLGSYSRQAEAEEHARNIISITGHSGVTVAKYGLAVPLTTEPNPDTIVNVPVDIKGKLVDLESAQYKQEKEELEKRTKIENDIIKEEEEECDINNIEHFKRQCFLAIKNKATYLYHQKQADQALEAYKKREANVRDHYRRIPEHEEKWLPYLKEKLEERGELDLYHFIASGYKDIKDELLGMKKEVKDLGLNLDKCLPPSVKKDGPLIPKKEIKDKPLNTKEDIIACECPGDVCEGLVDSCEDGICLVDDSHKHITRDPSLLNDMTSRRSSITSCDCSKESVKKD